ncbi:MAG: adenylate/guanylate cyclase domain-containing protein, partial [Alkalispirochaeta sp.]
MSVDLRAQIEEFYLPRQLVDAIIEVGGIPRESEESEIGVGFIDIANYTFLSKFLTPKENQEVLNGLYTAFNSVLRRHGGYLNKIEGDSLMFHYGGLIDSQARALEDPGRVKRYIAKQLFHTCVEMQRVSVHFNNADARFLDDAATEIDRDALVRAFAIIQRLRSDDAIANPLSAMFQI